MKKEYTDNEARYKAESYCSIAERCIFDVQLKLQQWGMSPQVIDSIIEYLVENNFINEQRYVKAFVHEKFHFNHWGRIKIQQSLRMKRLPCTLIEEAMEIIDEADYMSSLVVMLQKKRKEIKASNDYERSGKLIRFALSRGYEMSDIVHCLKKIGCADEYME